MPARPSPDPRLAPVEQNMLAQYDVISRCPVARRLPDSDVLAFTSDFPLAMFNFIGGARFAPGQEETRTRQLLDHFLDRGRSQAIPFLWWPTPSTTSPRLEGALLDAGLEPERFTGMHAALGEPVDPRVPDSVELAMAPQPEEFGLAMALGYGVDPELGPLLGAMLSVFSPAQMLKVVARDVATDAPVASGALFVTDDVAGIYSLAVRPSHRGRGVGSAITRMLTNVGTMHGCRQAVLHATEESLHLFEDRGFEAVCEMPQYSWYPPRS